MYTTCRITVQNERCFRGCDAISLPVPVSQAAGSPSLRRPVSLHASVSSILGRGGALPPSLLHWPEQPTARCPCPTDRAAFLRTCRLVSCEGWRMCWGLSAAVARSCRPQLPHHPLSPPPPAEEPSLRLCLRDPTRLELAAQGPRRRWAGGGLPVSRRQILQNPPTSRRTDHSGDHSIVQW
jgi:hypothetical protein